MKRYLLRENIFLPGLLVPGLQAQDMIYKKIGFIMDMVYYTFLNH